MLDAGELLKEASQAAKSSNYLMALQRALRLYEFNNDTPLLDILFCKSNYLYKAKKKEEAWVNLKKTDQIHHLGLFRLFSGNS